MLSNIWSDGIPVHAKCRVWIGGLSQNLVFYNVWSAGIPQYPIFESVGLAVSPQITRFRVLGVPTAPNPLFCGFWIGG